MNKRKSGVKRRLRRTDNLTPKERRRTMRAVRGRDTTPERLVASALKALGVRFRTQAEDLPGRPDFVLDSLATTIFVQGCWWHLHGCRSGWPQHNAIYWKEKLRRNRQRDGRVRRALNRRGWTVLVIWECSLKR